MPRVALEESIETFVEANDVGFRAGHRANGHIIAEVQIPVSALAEYVNSKLQLSLTMTGQGQITSALQHFDSFCFAEASLIDLVILATDPNILQLEETGPEDLEMLLDQLECAVKLVRATLNR